jgi:hypothetical protein
LALTVLTKITVAAVGATLPLLINAAIQHDTMRQQTSLQRTLDEMCPTVWENMDRVRSLPQYHEVMKWCPEA